MGLFGKKKHDLELHIIRDNHGGMIVSNDPIVHLFNGCCEELGISDQFYREDLAAELICEAIINRRKRKERIDSMRESVRRSENNWKEFAEIHSYEDFFYIASSKDDMAIRLNEGRSIYLEGFVYEIWNFSGFDIHSIKIVPFPCTSLADKEDVSYLVKKSPQETVAYIEAVPDTLTPLKVGDHISVLGKVTKFKKDYESSSPYFVGISATAISKIER